MSWYRDFFASGDYARVYGHVQEPARAAREAAFAAQALGLAPGARVLDLCCGQGRHLRALRALGFRAQGLDLHHASGPDVQADMRALPLRSGSLDGVVSLFSSFGYLESDEEDLRVLREIARVLKPGGAALIDLLNREHALAGFTPSVQRLDEDGTLVVEQRSWDALRGRLTTAFVVIAPDGMRKDSEGHTLRLYTLPELNRMLQLCGLTLGPLYGSFHAEPHSLDSVRLILSATKVGDSGTPYVTPTKG